MNDFNVLLRGIEEENKKGDYEGIRHSGTPHETKRDLYYFVNHCFPDEIMDDVIKEAIEFWTNYFEKEN